MKLKYLPHSLAIALSIVMFDTSASNSTNPSISLFPSTVKQDLKQSVEATKQLEDNIQPIIEQMSATETLFRAANCDGEAADQGCSQLKKQLQQQYFDLLNEVDTFLPEVEKSIIATHQSLSKSITKTLGRTKTPYQLQREMLQQSKTIEDRVRSKSKRGLSARLQNLLRLTQTKSDPGSVLVAASEFFLDASDSLLILSQTRAAIAQAKTQAALDLELGSLSEEMFTTVDSVKSIINEDDYDAISDTDVTLMPETEADFDESSLIL